MFPAHAGMIPTHAVNICMLIATAKTLFLFLSVLNSYRLIFRYIFVFYNEFSFIMKNDLFVAYSKQNSIL